MQFYGKVYILEQIQRYRLYVQPYNDYMSGIHKRKEFPFNKLYITFISIHSGEGYDLLGFQVNSTRGSINKDSLAAVSIGNMHRGPIDLEGVVTHITQIVTVNPLVATMAINNRAFLEHNTKHT